MSDISLVGMNLAAVNYYSTQFPFIDRMKSAGSWTATGVDRSLIQLDRDGYPLDVPAGANDIYTMVGMDPASAGTVNTYVLTYSGTASFILLGAKILSNEQGRITFEYTGGDNHMLLAVKNLDAKAPLGDMHIVRSDQEALFAAGEIFNPTFTDKIGAFDTLRYMDWSSVNNTTVRDWADRTTTDDRTWQGTGDSNVPIEVMVALANKTMTNMWLNVPTMASDDYVRQMMAYVRDNLDPKLSVKLEYSNEVWNFGFQQAAYAHEEAAKMWGQDANGDGVINPKDQAEQLGSGWVEFYGYRAAQIASIADKVFGDDAARLSNVLATQTAYLGLESHIIKGIGRANLGEISALFDDYAITTYFGGNLRGATEADRATVLSWARSGKAGMASAMAALKDGTGLSGEGSLAGLKSIYAYHAAVASKLGLDLVAYEGGSDFAVAAFQSASERAEVLTFFQKLQTDPRTGDLYKQMMDDFGAAGGKLAAALIDAAVDAPHGMHGLLKSIYDKGSPAWDALIAAQKAIDANAPVASSPPPANPEPAPADPEPTPAKPEPMPAEPAPTPDVPTAGPETPSILPAAPVPVPETPVAGPDVPSVLPASPEPVAPLVTMPALPAGLTDQAAYAMADGERTVTYIGTDAFTAVGNALDNTITAGDAGGSLRGEAGADVLIGGGGADRLDGGLGADTLIGGGGDDMYLVDDAGDVVIEKADGGSDEVRTTLGAYALDADVENLTYTGTASFTGTGNAAANMLTGGGRADLLDGGAGDDVLTGGLGDDTFIVDSAGDRVVEAEGGGADTVRTKLAAYVLPDRVEALVYFGIDSFLGTGNEAANTIVGTSGADRLQGLGGNDELEGGAGGDVLDGGAGDDKMTGGLGDDVYIVDTINDRIVEQAGQGTDEVRTTLAAYTLNADLENLTHVGTGAFNGTGNALNNVLTAGSGGARLFGGDGDDVLKGVGGVDQLDGGTGDDLLDGGAGDDVLTGGLGDDVYLVDSVGDRIVEQTAQGDDEVRTALASYTLGDQLEKLTHIGAGTFTGTGNALDNVLIAGSGGNRLFGGEGNDLLNGGAGADYLDGGSGVDRMVGGGGDDIYLVDGYRDVVAEERGGGVDEVRTALGTFSLSGQVENLTFVGTGAFQGMGNALDNVLVGGSGQNRLLGGDGGDTLIGGDATDMLDGGTGSDRMVGGGGNDVYFVDAGSDVVVEGGNAGLDTVYSSASYALSTNVENLLLFGANAIDGTGNDLSNKLVGNAAANRLSGGGGGDALNGGGGGDVLEGGDGDDTVVGDDGDDTVLGSGGNDVLVGGAGDDVLAGGAGSDSLTGNGGADRFVFGLGDLAADPSKSDRILDFSRVEGDKIDLSAFDADDAAGVLDAFSFIGSAAFSNRAGELRIDTSGTYQVVSGDLNGDGVADFTINVSKAFGVLAAADFLL